MNKEHHHIPLHPCLSVAEASQACFKSTFTDSKYPSAIANKSGVRPWGSVASELCYKKNLIIDFLDCIFKSSHLQTFRPKIK